MSSSATLGYWDTRGIGQPIRYMLKYIGKPFDDKRYPFGKGTSLQEMNKWKIHWYNQKNSIGLDFPNLPYLIDGDFKITQSLAIMRYLSRTNGMDVNDNRAMVRQDIIWGSVWDFLIGSWGPFVTNNDYDKMRNQFINNKLLSQLESWSKFLGTNVWYACDKLTFVDFFMYEVLDWMRLFSDESFKKFQNLVDYHKRFQEIPQIKEYINSKEFKSFPVFNPACKFGY